MVRIAISVEGLTEERFIQNLLVPYLQDRGIYAVPLQLGSHGGDVSFPRITKDLNKLANCFDKVTTLYDFYGFRGKEKGENKESLEKRIVACVAAPLRDRIIPYVQMYEFEGILFSLPEAIENNIPQGGLSDWANNVLQQFGGDPEKINDSPQTAPSKRLLKKNTLYKNSAWPRHCQRNRLSYFAGKVHGFCCLVE